MSADLLDGVDWSRPWLAPLLPAALPILQADDRLQALNVAVRTLNIRNHRGLPLQFVPQTALPAGISYEAFISATGGVPTRDNLHDFFNALVWLTFPNIKVQLNALQAAAMAQAAATITAPQQRGKLRDAATIFDENAALLVTRNPSLTEALRAHQWQRVFIEQRVAFEQDCEVFLFGHALMEKLVAPYKAVTAHTLIVLAEDDFFSCSAQDKRDWLNAAVSRQIASGLASSDFAHLPVLGVPGWWRGQNGKFYADNKVFRARRE